MSKKNKKKYEVDIEFTDMKMDTEDYVDDFHFEPVKIPLRAYVFFVILVVSVSCIFAAIPLVI